MTDEVSPTEEAIEDEFSGRSNDDYLVIGGLITVLVFLLFCVIAILVAYFGGD